MHGISYTHSIWDSLLIPLQIIFPDFFKPKLFIRIKIFSFIKKKKTKKAEYTQKEIGLNLRLKDWR